jgi:hypothetical protein
MWLPIPAAQAAVKQSMVKGLRSTQPKNKPIILKGAGLSRPLKQPRRQIQLPPKTIINNQIIVKVKARGCGRSLRSLPYPLTFHIGVHIQKTDTL